MQNDEAGISNRGARTQAWARANRALCIRTRTYMPRSHSHEHHPEVSWCSFLAELLIPQLSSLRELRCVCVCVCLLSFGALRPGAMVKQLFSPASKGVGQDTPGQEGKLCWLAEKIPRPVRTGDTFADEDAVLHHGAFVKVVDMLWKNSQHSMPVLQFLERRLGRAKMGINEPESMFHKLSTLRALDETWCAGWLMRTGDLQQKHIEAWKEYDYDAVRFLVVYALGCGLGLRLPGACKDEAVTTKLFDARYEKLGRRLDRLKKCDAWDRKTFAIKWDVVGIYGLEWTKNGYAARLTHRPSNTIVEVPKHVHISRSYDLVENYSEWTARFELKPNKYFLHEFFVKGQGPHAEVSWRGDSKQFKEAVQVAVDIVDGERRQQDEAVVKPTEHFMEEQSKKKRERAAEKARTALQSRMRETQKKRRVALGPPVPEGGSEEPVVAASSE